MAAVATGSVLIVGGFAAVVVSVVAEPPLFRDGEGWGWPFWTHVMIVAPYSGNLARRRRTSSTAAITAGPTGATASDSTQNPGKGSGGGVSSSCG